jgi:hypothetical protein
MGTKAYSPLSSFTLGFPDKPRLFIGVRIGILLMWPAICLGLILAKLLGSLEWSWIIILSPIWLLVLIFSILLIGAMWLDQLMQR